MVREKSSKYLIFESFRSDHLIPMLMEKYDDVLAFETRKAKS